MGFDVNRDKQPTFIICSTLICDTVSAVIYNTMFNSIKLLRSRLDFLLNSHLLPLHSK